MPVSKYQKEPVFKEDVVAFLEDFLAERYASEPYSSHHLDHLYRVRATALEIARSTDADTRVLEPAALLHDIGRLKEKPGECHAEISAYFAEKILLGKGMPTNHMRQICYAIKMHRYSLGIIPATLEARILQDADRLDALGAIGIVRVITHGKFAKFYNTDEPFPYKREYQSEFTLDHFFEKILNLKDTLHTYEAKKIAEKRHSFLLCFLEQLKEEL